MYNITYNVGARYAVIGRVTNGTSVLAYVVKDAQMPGKIYPMKKDVVEELALKKQIYNCSAQLYAGIVNMKGINCKLSRLPRYDMQCNRIPEKTKEEKPTKSKADLILVAKIQNGRSIIAYIIKKAEDDTSNGKRISKQDVLKLARDGRLVNAKCQMNNDKLMLRAAPGYSLSELPTLEE